MLMGLTLENWDENLVPLFLFFGFLSLFKKFLVS